MAYPPGAMSEHQVRSLEQGDEFYIVSENTMGKWFMKGPYFLGYFREKDMDGPTTTMIGYQDKNSSKPEYYESYLSALCWHNHIFRTAEEARSRLQWERKLSRRTP